MPRSLPPRPNLEQLHKQAKEILKAHRAGNASACVALRHLRQFATAGDPEILASRVGLQEVQFALAMEYGFPSWSHLAAHVQALQAAGRQGAPGEDALTGVGSARIASIKPLEWKIGNQCTFIGAMRVALEAMGDDVSYNELMGLSGAAFRLCFCQPRWDYSSVDGMLSYDHGAVAMEALGYEQCAISGGGNPSQPESQPVRDDICRSIDAGRPVLGIDVVVCPEWGVIAGYEDAGKTWLCRSYFDKRPGIALGADGLVRSDRWPWIRLLFGPKGKMPSATERLIEAIRVAVTFSREDEYFTSGGGARYARGLTAYRAWAQGLEEDARYANEKDLKHHWCVNCFCYDALVDARIAAAQFLKAHAGDLPNGAAKVAPAASLFGQLATGLQKARSTVVPLYTDDRPVEEWTAQLRKEQAALPRQCAESEKRALALLADAIRA